MKEETFIKNNFDKIVIDASQSGSNEFYYYSLEISDITILSTANDESEQGWGCTLFDHDLMITEEEDLETLIKILKRALVSQK